MMISIRNSIAACAVFGAVAVSPAHATTVAFDDVGFGNLTGTNKPNVLDNSSAIVKATITKTSRGISVVDTVTETLNGKPFSLTQHGSQIGTGNSYLAGFTFNLTNVADLAVTNVTAGAKYRVVKDLKSLPNPPGAYPASITGIGVPVGSYANLVPYKYTLLFEGITNLAIGHSITLTAEISAVPLPGALAMFGSALLGLTAFARRRRAIPE